jgi:mevalonate kinase
MKHSTTVGLHMTLGTACGKIILFGEHAVVYGRPALAVPLSQLRARAVVEPRAENGIVIHARDLKRDILVDPTNVEDALVTITRLTLEKIGALGDLDISVESDIPLASGFGSGAAISTAIVRALAAYFGKNLTPAEISMLVYETEKLYHGTPSGVDNTVIAYEQPVRFVRNQEITPFLIAHPFTLAIANTGISSPTKVTVGDVRRGWELDPAHYEKMFDAIGAIVEQAQAALALGENERLGELMLRNQQELQALGVSSPEIEHLIEVGMRAGARGGKLSGGGRGGNVIFHVPPENIVQVRQALLDAGASSVIVTTVGTE